MKHTLWLRVANVVTAIVLLISIFPATYAQSAFTYTPIVKRSDLDPMGRRFFDCDECTGAISNFNNRGELILDTETLSYCTDATYFISSENNKILLQNDCYTPLSEQFFSSGLAINDEGQMVLGVNKYLDGEFNKRVLFLYSNGEFTPIAADREPTPVGTTFSRSGLVGAHINNKGDIIFTGYSTDSEGKEGADVFLYSNGELRSLVGSGTQSPIGGTFYFLRSGSFPQINAKGEALFSSAVIDSTDFGFTDGLFLITRDGIKKIVVSYEPLSADILAEHPIGTLNDKGEVAFSSNTSNYYTENEGGIYFYSREQIQRVMREGQSTPIGGTFGSISKANDYIPRPFINNNSAIAFKAIVHNGSSPLAIFLASPKAMLKIVAVGDEIDGAKIADIGSFSLNDQGQVAFFAFDKKNRTLGVFKATPITPEIKKVKLKNKNGNLELRINGTGFITNDTVIEVSGVALDVMSYPEDGREEGGTSFQVISRDGRLQQLLQAGQPVNITVFNALTNQRSIHKEFIR